MAACGPTQNANPSESESAVDWTPRIRQANEVLLNEGDLDRIPEYFSESYVVREGGEVAQGRDAIRGFLQALRTAFPDLRVEIEVLVAQGDRVAWIRTHHGTHQAEFMGVPGSGRELTWQDMIVTRYEGNMIAEEWGVSGLPGVIHAP